MCYEPTSKLYQRHSSCSIHMHYLRNRVLPKYGRCLYIGQSNHRQLRRLRFLDYLSDLRPRHSIEREQKRLQLYWIHKPDWPELRSQLLDEPASLYWMPIRFILQWNKLHHLFEQHIRLRLLDVRSDKQQCLLVVPANLLHEQSGWMRSSQSDTDSNSKPNTKQHDCHFIHRQGIQCNPRFSCCSLRLNQLVN